MKLTVNLNDGSIQDDRLPHSHPGMNHNVLTDRDIWTELATQSIVNGNLLSKIKNKLSCLSLDRL